MLDALMNAVTKCLVYGLLVTAILWGWYQWKKRDLLQVARKLPCTVRPLPIIGHAHLLLFKSWEETTKVVLEAFSLAAVSRGLHNTCAWCGPVPILMVHNPKDVQKIFTSPCAAEKGLEVEFLKYALGNGLLLAPLHIWKLTRRHISPLFHSHNIEQLMVVFNNNSRELVADLAEHVDGGPVDMLHPAMSVALKTVCQLIFGPKVDFDNKSEAFQSMLKALHIQQSKIILVNLVICPLLEREDLHAKVDRNPINIPRNNFNLDWPRKPIKILQRKHIYNITLNGHLIEFFIRLRKHFSKFNNFGCPLNLLDVYEGLQKKHHQFTDSDLLSEIKTLYGTGTDTVGLTVSTCVLVLGRHTKIQDRVYEEISAVVGPDGDVTMDHIRRMQYLDQVYKETLRWATIVPYIIRRTTEDMTLSDCTIPAGNSVTVCLIGPLMDPKIYPKPQKFDPERFSPENCSAKTKQSFIPFGAGRMCIGKTYSNYLVKTILVHMIRRYRFSTEMDIDNLKKILAITLVSSEGYYVKLQSR